MVKRKIFNIKKVFSKAEAFQRRKEEIFKKVSELSLMFRAEIFLTIVHKKQLHILSNHSTIDSFFNKFLAKGKPKVIKEYFTPEQVIHFFYF